MHVVLEVARTGIVIHAARTEPRIAVVHDHNHRRRCDRSAEREVKRILIRIIVDERQCTSEGTEGRGVQPNDERNSGSRKQDCPRRDVGRHAESGRKSTSARAGDGLQGQGRCAVVLYGERSLQRRAWRSRAKVNAAGAVGNIGTAIQHCDFRCDWS